VQFSDISVERGQNKAVSPPLAGGNPRGRVL